MYTVIRTRVFDDWLATVVPAVSQLVLLGAGFDSRAFRLDWPPGVRLWELDQASLLAAKEAILAQVAAIPGCQRHTVAVDFAADRPGKLASAWPSARASDRLAGRRAPPVSGARRCHRAARCRQ